MLSNREKALVVVSYYKGAADNDVIRGNIKESNAYGISVECSEKIMQELGLTIDFEEDFEDFMKELDIITGILTKEYDEDKRFTGTRRSPVHCLICKTDYIDFCMKHYHIPGSWEIRDQ